MIDGGEWAYCGSGGITPAFGAKVDIKNVFVHDNERGLQYFGADGYKRRNVMAINCVSVGNTIDVFADILYDVVLANSVYRTKSVTGSSVITEYGNTVMN